MRKSALGIIILGWIEMLTLLTSFFTLVRIEYYPIILLFLPLPIAILGIFTIKLNPSARRLNLLLSPLIVFTYTCGFMMLFEYLSSIFHLFINLNSIAFSIFFILGLVFHISFFVNPKIRDQFKKKKRKKGRFYF